MIFIIPSFDNASNEDYKNRTTANVEDDICLEI